MFVYKIVAKLRRWAEYTYNSLSKISVPESVSNIATVLAKYFVSAG